MAMASRVLWRNLCFAAARYPRSISAAPFLAAKDLATSLTAPAATCSRSFSNSALDVKPSKQGDGRLLKVLKAEIEREKDNEVLELKPPSPFTLENKPGSQDVVLRRAYNSEDIAITCVFRLSDFDEPVSGEEDDDDAEDVAQEEVDMMVTISKGADKPFLEISCTCTKEEDKVDEVDEGSVEIDKVSFEIHKVSYLESKPGKNDESLPYAGPDFAELDEDLQNQFKKFLDARGINDELCTFLITCLRRSVRSTFSG